MGRFESTLLALPSSGVNLLSEEWPAIKRSAGRLGSLCSLTMEYTYGSTGVCAMPYSLEKSRWLFRISRGVASTFS